MKGRSISNLTDAVLLHPDYHNDESYLQHAICQLAFLLLVFEALDEQRDAK